jgi:DNA-directed RNA polymerase subunit beta'
VGRLIPAGTGAFMNKMRTIAADRDREIAELSQAEEPVALPPADEGEEAVEPAE